jgi:hypothetical protein
MKRSQPRRRTPLRRTTEVHANRALRPGPPPKRRTGLRRFRPLVAGASFLTSPAQREKVAGLGCLVCGRRGRVDPAHLVPRTLGGCDDESCVVPLCRWCHRAYDDGELDLVGYLEPRWRAEVAHAILHLGLIGALRRLSGRRDADADALGCPGAGR